MARIENTKDFLTVEAARLVGAKVHVEKIVPADVSRPAKGAVKALTAPIPKKEQEK